MNTFKCSTGDINRPLLFTILSVRDQETCISPWYRITGKVHYKVKQEYVFRLCYTGFKTEVISFRTEKFILFLPLDVRTLLRNSHK